MQYEQVILFVVFCLAIYYLAMIVMDLQKAKAAKQAEAENNKEEDIDISDEAKQFCPVKITREVKPKQAETETETEQTTDGQKDEQKTSKGENVKAAKATNNTNITENTENGDKAENNGNKQKKATDEIPQKHPQPKPDEQKANSLLHEPKNGDVPSENEEQKPQRKLRKAIMTDGIDSDKLVEYAEAGILDEKIGPIVMGCENAMMDIE